MRVKFKARNIMLRRYKPWRLAFLPVVELVSILKFLNGLTSNKWHLSRTGKVKTRSRFIDLSQSAIILATYCIAGMGMFFIPANSGKRLTKRLPNGLNRDI
jgi:hypothetical protein